MWINLPLNRAAEDICLYIEGFVKMSITLQFFTCDKVNRIRLWRWISEKGDGHFNKLIQRKPLKHKWLWQNQPVFAGTFYLLLWNSGYQVEQIYTKCPFGEGPTENVEEWKAHFIKKKKRARWEQLEAFRWHTSLFGGEVLPEPAGSCAKTSLPRETPSASPFVLALIWKCAIQL